MNTEIDTPDKDDAPDRRIFRWAAYATILAAVIAVLQFVFSAGPDPESAVVVGDLVGTWTTTVVSDVGTSVWEQTFTDDGTFIFSATGPGAPPDQIGTVRAANGTWSITSPATNWVDGGRYELQSDDTLILHSKLGRGIWKRVR